MSAKANQALTPEAIAAIESAVFALAEKEIAAAQLDQAYFLLAVDFEKEMGHWFLRLYVDRQALDRKMTLDDCEIISRAIDSSLDTLPALGDLKYNLEVSSPGLFRALKTPREFAFYQNQPVKVQPAASSPKTPKPFEGVMGGFNPAENLMELKPSIDTTTPSQWIALDGSVQVYLNPPITVLETSME